MRAHVIHTAAGWQVSGDSFCTIISSMGVGLCCPPA
jgi:hypothetical protein